MTAPVVSRDGNSITVTVPTLTRVTDPHEIKRRAMNEYRTKFKLAGKAVSERALERFAMQELNLVDAFGRDESLRRARYARNQPPRHGIPRQELAGHLAKHGFELHKGRHGDPDRAYDSQGVTRIKAHHMGDKVSAAVARIGRILQSDGATQVPDVDRAIAGCAVPDLAREFLEHWFYYQMRHRPSRFNPYFGLSLKDAGRKFLRAIYDICDRSTKVPWLGQWWTAVRR